jgi:hypothetical protein
MRRCDDRLLFAGECLACRQSRDRLAKYDGHRPWEQLGHHEQRVEHSNGIQNFPDHSSSRVSQSFRSIHAVSVSERTGEERHRSRL